LYPELVEEINESIRKREQAEKERKERLTSGGAAAGSQDNAVNNNQADNSTILRRQDPSWIFSFMSNVVVMIGLAAFAYIVKYVFNSIS
jgi:hypothetical protein